jgi:hypothetical protein
VEIEEMGRKIDKIMGGFGQNIDVCLSLDGKTHSAKMRFARIVG